MKIRSVFLKLLHTDIFGNVHEHIFATFTWNWPTKIFACFLVATFHSWSLLPQTFYTLQFLPIFHMCWILNGMYRKLGHEVHYWAMVLERGVWTITHHLLCFKAYPKTLLHRQQHSPQCQSTSFRPCTPIHTETCTPTKVHVKNTHTYNFSVHRIWILTTLIITKTIVLQCSMSTSHIITHLGHRYRVTALTID
jgi:hypothetical protein